MDCLTLEIRIFSNGLYRKIMSKVDSNLTMHQSLILSYITAHADRPVTQKEIEELFCIRRSTANHMFQLMEKNGYISRTQSSEDARVKVLSITDKGVGAHKEFSNKLSEFENQLLQGCSEEEIQAFRNTMGKLWRNISEED